MSTTAPAKRRATRQGRQAARQVTRSRAARVAARSAYVARAVFYLLLAGLVARTAYDGSTAGKQTNAHGALSVIASTWPGKVAIAAAALGFVFLGVERGAAAIRGGGRERLRRAVTALQGVFYLALAWVPVSFLLGNNQTGSEQAQRRETASILGWPAGREIVVVLGLVVVGVCAYQVRMAVTQSFTDGLALQRASRWVRWFAEAAGTIGIAARAVVFLPVGAFLIVAAVQADPQHAKGLDAELAMLARRSWWGPALLGVVALGLVVFAAYSGVEARYRRVDRCA